MHEESPENAAADYPDETALRELALKIWRFYRQFAQVVFPAALLGALAVGMWVSFNPLFEVTAILDTPQLSLNEWRSFSPLLADKALVEASLSATTELKKDDQEATAKSFITPKFWESRVQYRTALRRDDVKETPNAEPKKTDTLGLEITITTRDENSAAQHFESIANHIRQTMLWYRLKNYLQDQRQVVERKRDETAIELIQLQFAIDQSTQRVAEMQKLLATYPELRRIDGTTVISVESGGGKYLSPLAQIVALKATISETNATMRAVRRKQEEMDLRGRFLAGLGTLPALSGSQLAAWLKERKRTFFTSLDGQSPVVQEVSHDLDLHLNEPLLYADLWRFKTLPASFRTPILNRSPVPIGILVFLAVGLLLPAGIGAFRAGQRLLAKVGK
jgi:hypothetical protein